jgi:hypothetical protein
MKEETKTSRTSDGRYCFCSSLLSIMDLMNNYYTSEHKFPFSLLSNHKHDKNGLQITRLGNVSEHMDKSIGRPVLQMKGAISANNYLEIDHIQLVGPFVYIQLSLLSPIMATFHLEVITTANVSLRLSFSTMYDGEEPRFLGRSLRLFQLFDSISIFILWLPIRLPLPKFTGWMMLVLDLNRIIDCYCKSTCTSANTTTLGLQSIKVIFIVFYRMSKFICYL